MGFKRQERYHVRRNIAGRWWYLTLSGDETRAPKLFGEDWSNGQPGAFTYAQAVKARDQKARHSPHVLFAIELVGTSLNS